MNQPLKIKLLCLLILAAVAGPVGASSPMPVTYLLTLTNGSLMPISPIAVYAGNGQVGKTQIGRPPSPGFIQLCQSGDPSLRIRELDMEADVTFKTQTIGLVMPGESRTVEVEVQDPLRQSIHFETMYGKTKDICAIGQINGHSLYALKQHVTSEVIGKDNVLQTGAFLDPVLPMGHDYLDMSVCEGQMSAISCLRSLSAANTGMAKVRFFSTYLSSVQMLLENKYGASETQSLIIPSSGAVEFRLKLKH